MYYHSRILFIVQRIRYTHPHGTPSGYHRREQVQRHADSERIGEHLHIQQHPRREEDIVTRPGAHAMQTGGKKDAPEYGHQHVREQQSRHAPGQHQQHVLPEDLPHQRLPRRPEGLAYA